MKLHVTCLVCGQDVHLARQLELPEGVPLGCPHCDPEVSEAIDRRRPPGEGTAARGAPLARRRPREGRSPALAGGHGAAVTWISRP